MAEANNLSQLCELTLTGLCEETNVEAGAVLLLPPDLQDQHPTAADLEIFTTKTTTDDCTGKIIPNVKYNYTLIFFKCEVSFMY